MGMGKEAEGQWGRGAEGKDLLQLLPCSPAPLLPCPPPLPSPARLEIADTEERESRTCRIQLLQKSVKALLTA